MGTKSAEAIRAQSVTGSEMTLELQKSGEAQEFLFEEKQIEWLTPVIQIGINGIHRKKGRAGISPDPGEYEKERFKALAVCFLFKRIQ
ncbi:MAG: hypothetical protein LUG99_20775 [Lachnospiraceae bacterium]|nr:hypothetical protein [Lachnospiraceae bacterium]